ncbi:MAG TPA: peroxidase family protein, partial [Gemmataceae bacterium]
PSTDINTVDGNGLSDFGYVFGQFMDHDMDLTPDGGAVFNIPSDPLQLNDPIGSLAFTRSQFDPNTGTSNPRQQINVDTSYLDLSQVYGSTDAVANALRTFSGGQLKSSDNGLLLPLNNATYFSPTAADPDPNQLAELNMANDAHAVDSTQLFAAGDVRANENIELTALQTLFVRNHNRIANELATMNSADFGFTIWNDENLYQEARKLNIAEAEMITYTEYLPDLLGPNALPAYTGYKPNVNAGIATEFSTVAFRFGHSLLSNEIERQDNNGADITDNPGLDASLDLATDFFDPNVLNPAGVTDPLTGHISTDIDAYLKADADGDANAMDVMAISGVRNLLFANGNAVNPGQDLIARDVQRARDDGIGTYNQLRAAMGLPTVTKFSQITSNVTVQNELLKAYGSVNNIDPFEGGLAEDHVPGSDMGPLFTSILAKQFAALRDGDRFFYGNETFTPAEQNILQQGNTLTKVIEANTHITNMQADAMRFTASMSGTVFNDLNNNGVQNAGEGALSGRIVELEDSSGNVLATTRTDSNGHYAFSNLNGISTGTFQVTVADMPNGWMVTTLNPVSHTFTSGDQSFTVNFGEVKHIRSGLASTSAAALTNSSGPGGALARAFTGSLDLTVTGSSSVAPAVSSGDATQTATIATALADSTGSGTAAKPQASAPAGQTSGAGSTSSGSNQSAAVLIAKRAKASQSTAGAVSDDQTLSDQ